MEDAHGAAGVAAGGGAAMSSYCVALVVDGNRVVLSQEWELDKGIEIDTINTLVRASLGSKDVRWKREFMDRVTELMRAYDKRRNGV
jgi:hypothetical protein